MAKVLVNIENDSYGKIMNVLKTVKDTFSDPIPYFQRQNLINHISKSLGIELEKVSHELMVPFSKGGRSPLNHEEIKSDLTSPEFLKFVEINSNNVSPSSEIINKLNEMLLQAQKASLDTSNLKWCINKILEGNIYIPTDNPHAIDWKTHYLPSKSIYLQMEEHFHEEKRRSSSHAPNKPSFHPSIMSSFTKAQAEILNKIDTEDFDIRDCLTLFERSKILPLISFKILEKHGVFDILSIEELINFLDKIAKGHKQEVPFNNDLHAVDILHMCHLFLTKGEVIQKAKLTIYDIASFLIAAIIHDFKHPGFTNMFLINSKDPIAIEYNDSSVLENYHLAEAFKIIYNEPNCNFLKKYSIDDEKLFRQRVIDCVLSTDQVKQGTIINSLKNLIATHNIKNGENSQNIINEDTPITTFNSQQLILNAILHCCEVGNPMRKLPSYQTRFQLLLDEFRNQGDKEKELKLPVSFLCDRANKNIPKTQVNYMQGMTKPIISLLCEIFPKMTFYLNWFEENLKFYMNVVATQPK